MTTLSADKQQREFPARNVSSCLEIVLLKRTFVLPWHQFLYAEGGNEEIRLALATHDVILTGTQLGSLLSDLCAQRVSQLRDSGRWDQFRPGSGPHITCISVEKVE
jgi:hypothetical protein